jgi:hypothetical protein
MSNSISTIGDWAEDVISSLGGDDHKDWEAFPPPRSTLHSQTTVMTERGVL